MKNDLFLANGYQSWTETRLLNYKEKIKGLGFLGKMKLIDNKFHVSNYGDYNFIRKKDKYSFSFTYLKRNNDYLFYGSLNEDAGYTIFYIENDKLYAYKDNVNYKTNKEEIIFDIFHQVGKKEDVFKNYSLAFNRNIRSNEKILGFTTWYRYFDKVREEDVLLDLKNIKDKGINFKYYQLDDGYFTYIGDYLTCNEKFKSGLKYLALKIKEYGMIPGIWLAPLCGSKNSKLFKEHKDWFLKDNKGKYIIQGANWDEAYVLDFNNEEVKLHLSNLLNELKSYGFKLFKLDFLYAGILKINDNETRASKMNEIMLFFANELKDEKIIGCGVNIFSSFFNVDYLRIGPDVSLKFDGDLYMKFINNERVSSKVAIENMENRYPLSFNFFINDPDVFFLKNTKMNEKQKTHLFESIKKYGGVYFTSDDVFLYSKEDVEKINSLID